MAKFTVSNMRELGERMSEYRKHTGREGPTPSLTHSTDKSSDDSKDHGKGTNHEAPSGPVQAPDDEVIERTLPAPIPKPQPINPQGE